MYFFWYACPKLYEIIVKNVKELHFPKKVRNFFSQMKDLDPRRECLHKKKSICCSEAEETVEHRACNKSVC